MSHASATQPNTTVEDAPTTSPLDAPAAGSALTVVFSPHEEAVGRILPISEPLTVIGRDVPGDGCLSADTKLSRIHFRVVFDRRAMCHRLGDAKSRNGTFVAGTRVELAILQPGDVVRAGESLFVYGPADPMAKVRERVAALAPSGLTVLLLGETGTGKERIARALHERSGRSGQLVAVNCAAFTKELLAAELFGHTK